MKRRKRTSKLKSIGIITAGIIISPAVAAGVIKGMTGLHSAAEFLSDVTIGEGTDVQEGNMENMTGIMLSNGFGWMADQSFFNTVNLKSGGPIPYPAQTDRKSGKVIQEMYGKYYGNQYFDLDNYGQVRNCTDVSASVLLAQSRLKPEFTIKLNSTPQVLIMHTHTTESFEPCEREYYDDSFSYRTSDENMNVVAVGEEIRLELEKYGISVIHDTTVHDYPSYNGSYERSAQTVKDIISKNPDIKVVLDIHRDAIASDGNLIAPVTEVNGKKAAQVMIISGCDDGTMGMPDYLQNFRLASLFQQQIEEDSPGITRPILFDYRQYNQDITTGSLLIEIGSHGNSIDQVKYSGSLIGNSIGKALQSII